MLYEFPTAEDRAAVETAVQVFLWTQNASTRDRMLRAARAVLDRYGISKLHLSSFTVEATSPGLSAIRGRREITGRECPGCGADIYEFPGKVKILSIREECGYDIVSYGCSCSSVFSKLEKA